MDDEEDKIKPSLVSIPCVFKTAVLGFVVRVNFVRAISF